MRRTSALLLYMICFSYAFAQNRNSVFNFLELPHSSHATALGGHNISLISDDVSLVFGNPALLASVSDKSLNLNYMTYMQGTNVASAAFAKIVGTRSTFGVTAQYVHYGSMMETTVADEVVGTFSAMDMAVSGLYAYNLSARWVGGVSGKLIYSKLADYSSVGLAVDLGVNYYNENADFSFSVLARNLGGQIKAYGDVHERLPVSLQAGFTQRLAHAPFRISLTCIDLNRWGEDDYYSGGETLSAGRLVLNHLVAGVDFLLSDNIYLAVGYNFRRAYEMKAAGSSHWAGFSAGGGMQLSRFKFGVAYAQYHLSTPSLIFNVSYNL